jgi:hypothetical protein
MVVNLQETGTKYDAPVDAPLPGLEGLPQVAAVRGPEEQQLEAEYYDTDANPVIGTQLGRLLAGAGLTDVDHVGPQRYLSAGDPDGALLPSSIVKSLAPVIVPAGIATEQELAPDTLEARLAADWQTHRAVGLTATIAGAWGRKRPGA